MTWLNPWAWLGLAALAVPVLVHLLARRQAKPLPFPTLRFLGAQRPVLARRDRLSDLLLLAVRATIVVAAVAALAQPHVLTNRRRDALNATLARAIVLDASPSMGRATSGGGTGLDAARREAQRLAAETPGVSTLESQHPARELAGQAAWLATQPGRHELVVVSDFQSGSFGDGDFAEVPTNIGVRLVRVPVTGQSPPLALTSHTPSLETAARVSVTPSATGVEWTTRSRTSSDVDRSPAMLAGDLERPRAEAALDAARELGGPGPVADHPVAIVFPGFAGRDTLLKEGTSLTEPWMGDVVAALRRDESLEVGLPFSIAADRIGGRARLLLFSSAEAGSLESAALIASVRRALSPVTTPEELEPSTIPDDVLRRWEREPSTVDAPAGGDERDSDGRWLWVVAIVLLILETWLRRRSGAETPRPMEVEHARVA